MISKTHILAHSLRVFQDNVLKFIFRESESENTFESLTRKKNNAPRIDYKTISNTFRIL